MAERKVGRYELIEEIGRGGFATVYKGRDPALDRWVALKVLHPGYARDSGIVQRFLAEARRAARLQHPNIVPIYEVGEEEGQLFIAMAYLPGGNLKQRLSGAPLPLEMAVAVVEQVGAALTYAHKKQLLHRDIKPANILFDEESRAVLADFGLVKSFVESGLTATGTLLGTPAYMAPEQWGNGGELGPAADIYALGVVAYEVLVGRVPFEGETGQVMGAHLNNPPPDPRSLNPVLSERVVAVLVKALEKAPKDRYESAKALGRALRSAWESGQEAAATQATLAERYGQVQKAVQAGQWGLVVSLCVEMRNLDPDYRDTGTLLALAAGNLAEEEKLRQAQHALEERYARAEALVEGGEYEEAAALLAELAEEAPEFNAEDVAGLLAAARLEVEKAHLYAQALEKLGSACPDEACTALLSLLALEPEHAEGRSRLVEAAEALVARLQALGGELESLTGERGRLEQRAVDAEHQLQALQERLGGEIESLTGKRESLERRLADAERQLKALQDERENWQAEVQTLQQALQEARDALEAGQSKTSPGEAVRKASQKGESTGHSPTGDRWVCPVDGKEMVRIPAGPFLYGDKKQQVTLPEFWIARTPVTNAEYARFVAATGHTPPEHWKGTTPPQKISDHPVVNVSWEDANAYAAWVGGRLPAEEEWEKAARGTDGREYPWGDNFDPQRCNTEESKIGTTTPVGNYSPEGDSPYGVADMAGNVWEWTRSFREERKDLRVLRGGAFHNSRYGARCAFRYGGLPSSLYDSSGFRVVVFPSASAL